ncbi:MAG: ThiF family adenylyltransferase [Cyanobacteriota bacterium]|nr:ThiF family adenylyltransferase [Cyanobacteriota bacterium]
MSEAFTAAIPADLDQLPSGSSLYGYVHPETQRLLVIGDAQAAEGLSGVQLLGCLEPAQQADTALLVRRGPSGQELEITWHGVPCKVEPYALEADLFSRNSGVLESSSLQQAGVIVCGCGSVGSLAALELARSGVGLFLLIDPELLAIENLCRHQCGMADVGRRKVEAVAERIRLINPRAVVETQALPLECLDPAVIDSFCTGCSDTLMLACADSRRADRHAARLAAALALPFLAIGLWERAFAGEIFYSHPDQPMPCYGCAFDGLGEDLTGRSGPGRRFYSNEAALEKLNFQPGIAIDIAYVVQVGLKLAIDLLNRANPNHVPRLLGRLSQYTLVCNSNDPRLGGERAEIFSHPLQVTTSVQVGYGAACPPCRWST